MISTAYFYGSASSNKYGYILSTMEGSFTQMKDIIL
jgi:hypothetical protein